MPQCPAQRLTSTLGECTAQSTDLLDPIARLLRLLLESRVLSVDDTVLAVLDRNHPKGTKQGHLWTHASDSGHIVDEHTPNWKDEHPVRCLRCV